MRSGVSSGKPGIGFISPCRRTSGGIEQDRCRSDAPSFFMARSISSMRGRPLAGASGVPRAAGAGRAVATARPGGGRRRRALGAAIGESASARGGGSAPRGAGFVHLERHRRRGRALARRRRSRCACASAPPRPCSAPAAARACSRTWSSPLDEHLGERVRRRALLDDRLQLLQRDRRRSRCDRRSAGAPPPACRSRG